MRHAMLAAATAAGWLAASSANGETIVGFTDIFGPTQWTQTVSGTFATATGSLGSATMTAAQLSLVGGNTVSPNPASDAPGCTGATYGLPGPCQVSMTTTRVLNPFQFRWSYTTADTTGPGGDLFGMLIDGARVQLSDPGGPVNQGGERVVSAALSFGWYLNCTDCTGGAASATITGFQAGQAGQPSQVPVSGTFALLGIGIVGLRAVRRLNVRGAGTH